MHRTFLCSCLAILILLSTVSLSAQNKQSRWAAGIGVNVLQYQPKQKGSDLQYSFYDVGIHLSGSRYLAAAFDFHTSFTYAPQVHFPTSTETFRMSSLFDMNYQLRFKINNGVFIKEESRIGPYLAFGIGGSYTQNNPDTYVPLGGGIRFKLNQRASIYAQSMRKFSLNKDFQHIEHLISFVYNLRKEDIQTPGPDIPEDISDEPGFVTMIPKDNDQDGIPNVQDKCPDLFGDQSNQGCPEEKLEIQEDFSSPSQVPIENITEEKLVVISELIKRPEINIKDEIPEKTTELLDNHQVVQSPCDHQEFGSLPYVYFANGSDALNASAKSALDEIADVLKTCNQMRLVVQGHTDDRGTENRNLLLSVMRAYKVKYYLVYEHGISQMRISSSGLGENAPIASNQTNDGREQNRRVDFKLAF